MKKKRILKVVLFIVLILLIVFMIHFIRNYVIISKIAKKQEVFTGVKNYSLVLEAGSDGSRENLTRIEQYYKDGKAMQIIKKNDETLFVNWYDEDTKEYITMSPTEGFASIETTELSFILQIPTLGNSMLEKVNWALISFISSSEVNGEECYLLDWGAKTYISKETGIRVKEENGTSVEADGTEHKNLQYIKEVKINELVDEDVSKPNLTGYEVVYN